MIHTLALIPEEQATELDPSPPRRSEDAPTLPLPLDPSADPGTDLDSTDLGARYATGRLIGQGGMGEVLSCVDQRIGREVAMKIVRRQHRSTRGIEARFLREARVQGQLEHPAIVPVYDLARDPQGNAFFTMKRVHGETLETLLARQASGQAGGDIGRHRLLAAFTQVCLAVHFAHARGVVHRDLKPSNVMLGDFGEVYVLDWGVAKVAHAEEEATPIEQSGERPIVRLAADETAAGVVLGTLGYMPPEQRKGEAVDARADVYALGAILFEILTLRPLHESDARARDPEIPPELDAVIRCATAEDPDARFANARELADAVERFLGGHRDLSTRAALARSHVESARATLEASRSANLDPTDRARVLEEVGRAIAVDPNNSDALGILVKLLTEPRRELPTEVTAELARAAERSRVHGLRKAIVLYTLPPFFVFLPAVLLGAASPLLSAICVGPWLVALGVAILSHKRNAITNRVPWVTVASSIAAATTVVLGGFATFLPAFVATNTISHAVACRPEQRRMVILLGALALMVPVALDTAGLVPHLELSRPIWTTFFVVVHIGLIVFTSIYVGQFRDALNRAEARRLLSLWQLRQMVPEPVRAATSDPPPNADATKP